MAQARVYSIAPDMPFLEQLASAILNGDLPVTGASAPDPLDLPRWTILLPTRRAVRALTEAFVKVSGGTSLLLPRIRPIGDVDEDEMLLSPQASLGGTPALELDLPPAIGSLERRLVLSGLILKWSAALRQRNMASGDISAPIFPAATPAQASLWAKELASLMDSAETEGVDLRALKGLVGEDYAAHWQLTLDFLAIVTEHWPVHLAEHNQLSPYERSERLIRAEAAHLAASPPEAPVIAAGSTGTRPATSRLLETIATLPNGAVVLPGLDFALDETSWQSIIQTPGHPQFGLAQLLRRLKLERDDVLPLGKPAISASGRTKLISEVMRPAGSTGKWTDYASKMTFEEARAAVDGITRINAPTAQGEAEVISLILREALKDRTQTAALVTPDRTLARRVSVRLEKWGLKIDDSAGKALDGTPPGTFIDLVAQVMETGFAPVPLMALLKHPLTRLGHGAGEARATARTLELAALRQPFAGSGIAAMRTQLTRTAESLAAHELRHPALKRLREQDLERAQILLGDIEAAFAPFKTFEKDTLHDAGSFAKAHAETAEALARDEKGNASALWSGNEGEALSLLFADLITQKNCGLEISSRDYPELYRSLIMGIAVRSRSPAHPRLFIWGPLEARLQRPDIVVMGGLNEDSWPAPQETGPWLSRPMLAELGLPAPERRIGLAAHDVSQLMGVRKVYLTRAMKTDGAPSVASRWLLRLEAVLSAMGCEKEIRKGDWLAWAARRDDVAPAPLLARPEPRPRVEARPTRLSVTRIETWIANPYAIFARDILRLQKLDPLLGEPDNRMRGLIVHDALNAFSRAHPERLPERIADELMRLARLELDKAGASPVIEAFWHPHLVRFAQWFAHSEPLRRAGVLRVSSEIGGTLELPGSGFVLSGRADRIDIAKDGTLGIYDYKTGTVPAKAWVADLRAPQLPLEAAMAAQGAFTDVPKGSTARLCYIHFLGRGEGGDEIHVSGDDPNALASRALENLQELVMAYARPEQHYAPMRRSKFKDSTAYRYDDYAHLARIAEWSAADGGEE